LKKIISYLSVFTLVLFLSNCDKSPTESTVDPLVGVWTWVSTSMTDGTTTLTDTPTTGSSETVIMNEDGTSSFTFTSDGETLTGSGTWSTNGTKLTWTMIFSGESTSTTLILDYSISGNVFTGSKVETIDGDEVTTTYTYTKS